eukprot:COSAG02_NODE_68129_length_251_cov_0.684211_1_plen_41_part_01
MSTFFSESRRVGFGDGEDGICAGVVHGRYFRRFVPVSKAL